MGCGSSKEEAAERYDGSIAGPKPPQKAGEESDTLSELSVRPVRPPSQPGHSRPPTHLASGPASAQAARPKRPDDRVNSANPKTSLQYVSPRGNLPVKRVEHIVAKSPPPPDKRLKDGQFPKKYWNSEGPADNRTPNFSDWEIRQQQDPGNPRNTETFEYPLKTLIPQKPAFTSEFDFERPPDNLKTVNAVIGPKEKDRYKQRWEKPPNDPGPIRAVVNKNHQVVGAMYHPEGNPRGYERARLEPLDGRGRGEIARYEDQQPTGRTTWPQRGQS